MNIFNRIVVVFLLLFLIVLSIVSVVNVFANLFKWSDVANRILNSTSSVNVYIAALILLLLLVVSIVLIIFEFYRRKTKTAPLSAVKSGLAMVNLKSASQQITEELIKIKDISDVKVNVLSKSDGVIINVYANLVKGQNVSVKMQEVIDNASKFASENLGFKIIKTNFTAIGFIPERVEKFGKLSKESINDKGIEKEEAPIKATGEANDIGKVETTMEKTTIEETITEESIADAAVKTETPVAEINTGEETASPSAYKYEENRD